MKKQRIILLIILVIILTAIFAYFFIFELSKKENNSTSNFSQNDPGNLTEAKIKISEENGITFEVTLLDFAFENQIKFDVKITAHSGSLDFDVAKISTFEDGAGNKYAALEWQGPPPGGHHISGILIFPKIDKGTEKIRLIIQDDSTRIFEWDLK